MLEMHGRHDVLERLNVTREAADKLIVFVDCLARWRRATDLMSEGSFATIWSRHIEDSAQLLDLCPMATRWLDFGAGAGFPGLIIAILLGADNLAEVHLVESDLRKCSFLRAAIAATGVHAFVHPVRIEQLDVGDLPSVDTVTARALARFPKLVELTGAWIKRGSIGLFPRGRQAEAELLAYPAQAEFAIDRVVSRTDPAGSILRVRSTRASPRCAYQGKDS